MNIAAKISRPSKTAGAAYFRSALKLPRPTSEFVAAENAYRKASDARRSLSGRLEALKVEANIDNPSRAKIPTHQLQEMLKGLAIELSEADLRDRETRAEFDRLRTIYREQVRNCLAGDVTSLGSAISQRLSEVLEMLDIASILGAQAREAGLELPGVINDALMARRLLEPSANTITRMIAKGSRQ
ncbi:hypothetical protein [Mesorhizobium sp. M1252]|uniref:hypothetical protein n=1 Tax=Mesorhizobium sp. M1252 TaxID=2957073 RepID=UPI003337AC1C